MGVIKTIFVFFLIYYISKFFIKYIAPIFLVKYVEKKTGQQGYRSNKPKEKEGTVTIDKKPNEKSGLKGDVGEYVDYEEIE